MAYIFAEWDSHRHRDGQQILLFSFNRNLLSRLNSSVVSSNNFQQPPAVLLLQEDIEKVSAEQWGRESLSTFLFAMKLEQTAKTQNNIWSQLDLNPPNLLNDPKTLKVEVALKENFC